MKFWIVYRKFTSRVRCLVKRQNLVILLKTLKPIKIAQARRCSNLMNGWMLIPYLVCFLLPTVKFHAACKNGLPPWCQCQHQREPGSHMINLNINWQEFPIQIGCHNKVSQSGRRLVIYQGIPLGFFFNVVVGCRHMKVSPTPQCQHGKLLCQALKVKICNLDKWYIKQGGVGKTIQKLGICSFIISLFQADIFINNEAPVFWIHPSFSENSDTVKTDSPKEANLTLF